MPDGMPWTRLDQHDWERALAETQYERAIDMRDAEIARLERENAALRRALQQAEAEKVALRQRADDNLREAALWQGRAVRWQSAATRAGIRTPDTDMPQRKRVA